MECGFVKLSQSSRGRSRLKFAENAGDADDTVIDGSALLWTVHWPADGSVADFIVNVKKWIA